MATAVIVRVMAAIWAFVLILLGVVFLLIGLLGGDDVEAFAPLGGALAAAAAPLGVIAWWLHRRATAERRRRREGARAVAEIVDARLHAMTRIGVMLTYTVTVRFAPQGGPEQTLTRTVLVPPTLPLEAGQRVEICYDPSEPANFEPLRAVEPGLHPPVRSSS